MKANASPAAFLQVTQAILAARREAPFAEPLANDTRPPATPACQGPTPEAGKDVRIHTPLRHPARFMASMSNEVLVDAHSEGVQVGAIEEGGGRELPPPAPVKPNVTVW